MTFASSAPIPAAALFCAMPATSTTRRAQLPSSGRGEGGGHTSGGHDEVGGSIVLGPHLAGELVLLLNRQRVARLPAPAPNGPLSLAR